MSDARDQLQRKWEPANRFANFGEAICSIHITRIRCHADTRLELESPITAFSGLNGCGKSTVLQLAACAYDRPHKTSHHVGDFIVANQLDRTAITPGQSSVKFEFWNLERKPRPFTLSYYRTYWKGYNRRPLQREVLFAGIGLYLPRSESKSIITKLRGLRVSQSSAVEGRIIDWAGKILGQGYDEILSHLVDVSTRHGNKLSSVKRNGVSYSEPNMGYGEARALHLVQSLETIPPKSLVLIEEPETSLHQSAQGEFANYLMDVCLNRGHQILLTTHSEFMLAMFPSASQVYLSRRDAVVRPVLGLTALQAKSLMADGKVKSLIIIVEDETAKAVLSAIIWRHEPALAATWGIHVGGDQDRIAASVRCLKETGLPLAAVRDGDTGPSPSENIFKLPGTLPPEKEIFQSSSVEKYFTATYSLSLSDFRATLTGVNHHEWFSRLAIRLGTDSKALVWEFARVYVSGLPEIETATVVNLLKEASPTLKKKT